MPTTTPCCRCCILLQTYVALVVKHEIVVTMLRAMVSDARDSFAAIQDRTSQYHVPYLAALQAYVTLVLKHENVMKMSPQDLPFFGTIQYHTLLRRGSKVHKIYIATDRLM